MTFQYTQEQIIDAYWFGWYNDCSGSFLEPLLGLAQDYGHFDLICDEGSYDIEFQPLDIFPNANLQYIKK